MYAMLHQTKTDAYEQCVVISSILQLTVANQITTTSTFWRIIICVVFIRSVQNMMVSYQEVIS